MEVLDGTTDVADGVKCLPLSTRKNARIVTGDWSDDTSILTTPSKKMKVKPSKTDLERSFLNFRDEMKKGGKCNILCLAPS